MEQKPIDPNVKTGTDKSMAMIDGKLIEIRNFDFENTSIEEILKNVEKTEDLEYILGRELEKIASSARHLVGKIENRERYDFDQYKERIYGHSKKVDVLRKELEKRGKEF